MTNLGEQKILLLDGNFKDGNDCKRILGGAFNFRDYSLTFSCMVVPSEGEMFDILDSGSYIPNLFLLALESDETDCHQVIGKLKSNDRYKNIPIILAARERDEDKEAAGFELGAVDYVYKPYNEAVLRWRVFNQILNSANNLKIKTLTHQKEILFNAMNANEELFLNTKLREKQLQNTIINAGVISLTARDECTGRHVDRTYRYLKILVEKMIAKGYYKTEFEGLTDQEMFLKSARLHDIGKIAISDLILNKDKELDDIEKELMKEHASKGAEMIRSFKDKHEKVLFDMDDAEPKPGDFLYHAARFAEYHHEQWDSNDGYPSEKNKNEIPFEGRLLAIVDVYDALVAKDRPYREAWSHEKACAHIEGLDGIQFDPMIVAAFKEIEEDLKNLIMEETAI